MRRAALVLLLLTGCPKNGEVGASGSTRGQATAPVPSASTGVVLKPGAPPLTASETVDPTTLPVEQRVNDAVLLMESGHPNGAERAVALLEGVVAQDPGSALAWFDLGVAHHQLEQLTKARDAWQKATDLDPAMDRAWLYLGIVQQRLGRTDLAMATWRTGLRKAPGSMVLREALVAGLREEGNLDEAIAEAKIALGYNSNSVPIYNDLGLAYMAKGDLDLAKFVYQKALASVAGAESSPDIHANLGWVYFRQGKIPDAESYLKKALALDPADLASLVYLSRIYLDNRNYPDTVPLLEKARDEEPDNHGVIVSLAVAYRGVGRLDDAVALYKKALALEPTNPDPHFNLGILYGDYKKEYDTAITELRTYVDSGGTERALALAYITDLEAEKKIFERRKESDEERKRKEEERRKREELLAQPPAPGAEPAPAPPPVAPAPAPAPAPEGGTEGTSGDTQNPWG